MGAEEKPEFTSQQPEKPETAENRTDQQAPLFTRGQLLTGSVSAGVALGLASILEPRPKVLIKAVLGLSPVGRVEGASPLPPFSVDHFPPRKEGIRPLDSQTPLWIPGAPNFIKECQAIAHPVNHPEILLKTGMEAIAVFVGFPDQTQGLAALRSGRYHNAAPAQLQAVDDWEKYFLGIPVTINTLDYYTHQRYTFVTSTHNYDYYTNNPNNLEDFAKDILTKALNLIGSVVGHGNRLQILVYVFVPDDINNPNMGPGARNLENIGEAIIPPAVFLSSDTFNKQVLIHEINGHGTGIPHNDTDLDSIMNVGNWKDGPKIFDKTDVKDVCNALPTPTPTRTPTRTSTPSPSPSPTITRRELFKNFLPFAIR